MFVTVNERLAGRLSEHPPRGLHCSSWGFPADRSAQWPRLCCSVHLEPQPGTDLGLAPPPKAAGPSVSAATIKSRWRCQQPPRCPPARSLLSSLTQHPGSLCIAKSDPAIHKRLQGLSLTPSSSLLCQFLPLSSRPALPQPHGPCSCFWNMPSWLSPQYLLRGKLRPPDSAGRLLAATGSSESQWCKCPCSEKPFPASSSSPQRAFHPPPGS